MNKQITEMGRRKENTLRCGHAVAADTFYCNHVTESTELMENICYIGFECCARLWHLCGYGFFEPVFS
ncbi:MAG: hypothetical protein JSV97_04705 [candidate division WOR-3 bacterium]|nr:MAG: hypothetical protein JSV97_04705 [candidate division WOR-3 bacterium]